MENTFLTVGGLYIALRFGTSMVFTIKKKKTDIQQVCSVKYIIWLERQTSKDRVLSFYVVCSRVNEPMRGNVLNKKHDVSHEQKSKCVCLFL